MIIVNRVIFTLTKSKLPDFLNNYLKLNYINYFVKWRFNICRNLFTYHFIPKINRQKSTKQLLT